MFNEDSQMIYNRWVSGIASRELKGQTLTVDDLIQKYSPQGSTLAPKNLPYPLDKIFESLADNFVKLSNSKMICEMSKNLMLKQLPGSKWPVVKPILLKPLNCKHG